MKAFLRRAVFHKEQIAHPNLDYSQDLEFETVRREFTSYPLPPPCLDDTQSVTVAQPNSCFNTHFTKVFSSQTELVFFSLQGNVQLNWDGPDPLSPDTCAEDVFAYISASLFVENFQWIEFRLTEYQESGAFIAQHSFPLPRIECFTGNLPHVQAQIQNIISQRDQASRFHLSVDVRQDIGPQAYKINDEQPLPLHGPSISLALDPRFFVHNIMDYSCWTSSVHFTVWGSALHWREKLGNGRTRSS